MDKYHKHLPLLDLIGFGPVKPVSLNYLSAFGEGVRSYGETRKELQNYINMSIPLLIVEKEIRPGKKIECAYLAANEEDLQKFFLENKENKAVNEQLTRYWFKQNYIPPKYYEDEEEIYDFEEWLGVLD